MKLLSAFFLFFLVWGGVSGEFFFSLSQSAFGEQHFTEFSSDQDLWQDLPIFVPYAAEMCEL